MDYYRANEGKWWLLFVRTTKNDKGCVAYVGKIPEVGSSLTLHSASVNVIEDDKRGRLATYKTFCNPEKPLRVLSVNLSLEKQNATVFVESIKVENEKSNPA